MKAQTLKHGSCNIHILGVIKGLVSETEEVRKAFEETKPDKVAVSLSKEEVEGLNNIPEDYDPQLSRYEEIYAEGLGRFGEVAAPPPCYVATVEMANHLNLPLVPVDMDERTYTEFYCMAVTGGNLLRHSTRTWIMKMRKFSTESPEDFVRAWDKAVNGLEGFRRIERMRAETIAEGIMKACDGTDSLLAVVELERARDVYDILDRQINGSSDEKE